MKKRVFHSLVKGTRKARFFLVKTKDRFWPDIFLFLLIYVTFLFDTKQTAEKSREQLRTLHSDNFQRDRPP